MLEDISDSEVHTHQTAEELDAKHHSKTEKSLQTMLHQMNAMNDVLDEVHSTIENNADNTIDFLQKINSQDETAKMPFVNNLDEMMH